MTIGVTMVTFEIEDRKYIVKQYSYITKRKRPSLLAELTFNTSLDAVTHLCGHGLTEEVVAAAYTAMYRRGFNKAYFDHKGDLIYLKD